MIFMDKRSQLIDIIQKRSLRKGPVRLASGQISDFYIDLKPTILYPKGLDLIGDLLLDVLRKKTTGLVGVGGMGLGAMPLATVVSLKSLKDEKPLLALHIRKQIKEHGTMKFVEGIDFFKPDEKIWILEDVVTTGQSSLLAVQRCQDAKLHVEGVLTCVDRQEGGQQHLTQQGVKFHTLFTKADLLSKA